jgi:hypothetical protein
MPFRANLKFVCTGVTRAPARAQANEKTPERQKPPLCPHCHIEMLWYQSRLQRQNGSSKIVHSFHCPNCAMVVQTEEPTKQALRVV